MIATTIKREYLDQIEAGTKMVDYRACNEFWKRRIEGKQHGVILFLCGRSVKAFKVTKIEIVTVPDSLREIILTEKCYAITMGGGLTSGPGR